jgi:hypothetical protein
MLYGYIDDNNDDGDDDYDYVYGEWTWQQVVIAEELFRILAGLWPDLVEVYMASLLQSNNMHTTKYGTVIFLKFMSIIHLLFAGLLYVLSLFIYAAQKAL